MVFTPIRSKGSPARNGSRWSNTSPEPRAEPSASPLASIAPHGAGSSDCGTISANTRPLSSANCSTQSNAPANIRASTTPAPVHNSPASAGQQHGCQPLSPSPDTMRDWRTNKTCAIGWPPSPTSPRASPRVSPDEIKNIDMPPLPEVHSRSAARTRQAKTATRRTPHRVLDTDAVLVPGGCGLSRYRRLHEPRPRRRTTGAATNDRRSAGKNSKRHLDKITVAAKKQMSTHGAPRYCAPAATRADLPPGTFSLTVPTGGGKTLSSMNFALRHARKHGLERVIVVIPYTSIIEQNAGVYRDVFGDGTVVEHHSNRDVARKQDDEPHQADAHELACENWDAPVVVTTSAQFFDSLFSNRSAACRKLHNIARSVVIFDEVQTFPPTMRRPILEALQELIDHYRVSMVFCTATQPALRAEDDPQGLGIRGIREIINDPPALFAALKRVEVRWPDDISAASAARRDRRPRRRTRTGARGRAQARRRASAGGKNGQGHDPPLGTHVPGASHGGLQKKSGSDSKTTIPVAWSRRSWSRRAWTWTSQWLCARSAGWIPWHRPRAAATAKAGESEACSKSSSPKVPRRPACP